MVHFIDRVDAGTRLAHRLGGFGSEDVLVLGIPRGGVPVAFEVARALSAPLDVVVVRKLGLPSRRELAMGAVGEDGFSTLDRGLIARARVSEEELRGVIAAEESLLAQRVALLRRGRVRADLSGRTAVVVDDGLATGSTARVACQVARHLGAARVVLAVPVAAGESLARTGADETVFVAAPRPFHAVAAFYRDFSPTSDQDVISLLDRADRDHRERLTADRRPPPGRGDAGRCRPSVPPAH